MTKQKKRRTQRQQEEANMTIRRMLQRPHFWRGFIDGLTLRFLWRRK